MDMQAAELGATVQLRKHFARIEQTVRVKRTFQALLVGQITLVEHGAHQVALFDPDPVLARQRTPSFNAKSEDVGTEGLGPLDLVGLIGIIKDQRVKIAVASVEHVRDREPVLFRQCSDPSQDRRQTSTIAG